MRTHPETFYHKIERSTLLTVIAILILFSGSIIVTLIAPRYIDPTWTQPTSDYQVQMYEISDPHLYLGSAKELNAPLEGVYHLKEGFSLLAFHESDTVRLVAPPELEKYITRLDDKELKLTSKLLLVRPPQKGSIGASGFDAVAAADALRQRLQKEQNPDQLKLDYTILELFATDLKEAFAIAPAQGMVENWVDRDFHIVDQENQHPYLNNKGVIYVNNPVEYRYSSYTFSGVDGWRYDPDGETISSVEQLQSPPMNFRSRHELIKLGEHIYSIEGCWYCHTDQTRTLVQDVVLNGSDSFPAPPSSANEYIYQEITFPGTRRIGPDISRVAIKRPSRDWHKAHFWAPKTASPGSIMPAFQHFFDDDPRGTSSSAIGIPNMQFEAIYQYLMTKGSRITPPTQAWWQGRDPIQTKEIIEGHKVLP